MPARVEGDLYLAVVVQSSFQIVVEPVDTDCVPVGERNRSTVSVPRSHELAASNLHQEPTPSSGTEATHSEKKSIVARLSSLPESAFLSDRRMEGYALIGYLRLEDFAFGVESAGAGGVLEERDDAVVNDGSYDDGRVFDDLRNVATTLDPGVLVAGGGEKTGHQQARRSNDARANHISIPTSFACSRLIP